MLRIESSSLADVARRTWDVVIVGAGPPGSMAALGLAGHGLDVLLVDRAAFPRWKVCGCCLNPFTLGILAGAGLGELVTERRARQVHTMRLAARRCSADL